MVGKDIQYTPLSRLKKPQRDNFLAIIKQVEKKTFPANEAFAFDEELAKRNTTLIVAIKDFDVDVGEELVGYLVYVRVKRVALLHKVCVVEHCRREGIARAMLISLREDLERQGCTIIQLWVDAERKPAKLLYSQLGFREAQRVDDYYGPGRTGLKMILELENR
jgi:ribosomal protein S18 acetylase RimI-like enzyme